MRSLSRGPSPLITVKVPRELLEELHRGKELYPGTWSAYLRLVLAAGNRAVVREAGVL